MGSNAAMVMPNAPEEVTLGWLQTIFDDQHISSFTITDKRLFETTSKLCITLSYVEGHGAGKPTHILLKGAFNPAMLAVPGYKPILIRVYTREVDFFTKFASTLPAAEAAEGDALQVPKVYWADASPDQAILAFEDLAATGFTFGDPTRTYSLAAVRSGVEQLAALHARTWGWEATETNEHSWVAMNIYDVTMRGLLAMWDELVLGADRPPLPGVIRDSRERTAKALETYFATRNPRFRCLVHGDPHSGNTYLDASLQTVRFLDWQITHVGTAFHDVAYFVVSMLTVAERREHENALLDHYLAALAKHGGPALARDDPEVAREYRKAQITGLGWVLTPHAMQKKERVAAMVERYAAAIVDHKTIELLTGEEEDGAAKTA